MQDTRPDFSNRNNLTNGDIIALNNLSPMRENQAFKPKSKRIVTSSNKNNTMPTTPKPFRRLNPDQSDRNHGIFSEKIFEPLLPAVAQKIQMENF